MMSKKYFVLFSLLVLFWGCSNSSTKSERESEFETEKNWDGMFFVAGSDEEVTLGTNVSGAKYSEKPVMKVVLDYGFQMDRHETTCSDFVSIMKENGPQGSFAKDFKCQNDSLPITNVTYYDAILFANAKSRANQLDSAYSYAQIVFDEDGHCTSLSSFVFHPEVDAFRLPTEAEWVKVASQDWNPSDGWNSENSNYKAHKVCSRDSIDSAFCDFSGNVMEWVNDWLGQFKDTTIVNYVGAPDGGELNERVVKGGAFNTEAVSTTLYARGDVYTVTSSTKTNYVGFRLAYGFIPNPVWLGYNGKVTKNIINPLANMYDIYSYTKSYNIKLAFRNDITGNLAFIDYTSGIQSVMEIEDTMDVYHPEISPNGEYVAFCTAIEGISKESELYVRNLDEDGSNLVKLSVESAAIPRWRVIDGDTLIVYVSSSGSNKTNDTWRNYSTWQVSFKNGTFGKPQKILDGSFHGGISTDNKLAVTGSSLLRARMVEDDEDDLNDGIDSVWYNGEQACNVSLAQDGSKRTAFLDFSGKTGQDFVGKKYSTHQYLLVADSTGELSQYVGAPDDYTFDHTEWAVGGANGNLIATLVTRDGAHQKISLVNLDEKVVVDLAEGEELWHPCLWIKAKKNSLSSSSSKITESSSSSSNDEISSSSVDENLSSSSSLDGDIEESGSSSSIEDASSNSEDVENFEDVWDPDSAGMYYNASGAATFADRFRYKMEFLWQYKDSANVAILGSSRAYYGVNPLLFSEPILAVNFSVPSTMIVGNSFLFHNYILPHLKKLKVVIISIDVDRGFETGDNESNIFYNAYKSYPGYVYDMNHDFWKDQNTEGLFEATYESPGIASVAKTLRPTRGYAASNAYGWGEPSVKNDTVWSDTAMAAFQNNLVILEDLVKACSEKEVYVVGVVFPLNPGYKETGAYGSSGLQRSVAPNIIAKIDEISAEYPNFIFVDENKYGDHDYSDDMAKDYGHLSSAGAEQLTQRLDSLIQTLNVDFGDL